MSRPLAQVFTVNAPIGGMSSVNIGAVCLYFQTISTVHGVTVQLREVANGVPTPCVVKNSRKSLTLTDTYSDGTLAIKASADGTAYTYFSFDSPVALDTNQQYALCVLPDGDDPAYSCWVGKLLDIDTLSQVPIQFNQYIGPLFFFSNDKTQTSTTDQALKFLLIENNCSKSRFHTDCYSFNEEHFVCNEFTNSFVIGETVYMSEDSFDLAYVTITSNTAAFINGEAFYQSNGTANIASGYIYTANSAVLLLDQIVGTLSNTYQLEGVSSSANAVLNNINTSIICSSTSNTVTFPFTGNNTSSLFYANQSIYLSANDSSDHEIFIVSSVSVDNKTIQLSYPPDFTDSACLAGIIRGDNMQLNCKWQGYDGDRFNNYVAHCSDSRANTMIDANFHFAHAEGCHLFGIHSRARCRVFGTIDLDYHCVVPHIWTDTYKENDHRFYWGGKARQRIWISNYPESYRYSPLLGVRNSYWGNGNWVYQEYYDDNYGKLGGLIADDDTPIFDPKYELSQRWDIGNECENEFLDNRRCWKSRSHEWLYDSGKRSVWFRHRCKMANNYVVPDIDPKASYITLIVNLLFKDEETYGYRLSYSNNFGYFLSGDIVSQVNDEGTSTAQVYRMDPNYIYLNICSGVFEAGNTIVSTNNSSINAYVTSSVEINEKYTANVFPGQSRYMSKSVILGDKQDAEDFKAVFTAYRPANTNFKIYAKTISSQDTDVYDNRIWSRLVENDQSVALFSSGTNLQDFVEIEYDFPTSNIVFSNSDGCGCTSGNNQIIIPASDPFSIGMFVYITDPSIGVFNLRQITDIPNNTILTLSSAATFSNTANLNIGIVPIENQSAGFCYDLNDNIVRYVRSDDTFYDSFKQFAVKIVPISDSPVIVPRLADMRCLALQV